MAIRKPTAPQARSSAMAEMLAENGQESKFKNGSLVEGTVSAVKGDEVFVTISNPVSGELLLKDGELQTTKKDERRHGFGLKNIKKAASNYGRDNVDYHVENGRFILRISLRFRDSLSA